MACGTTAVIEYEGKNYRKHTDPNLIKWIRKGKPISDLGIVRKWKGRTIVQICYPHAVSPGYNGWIEWGGREGDRSLVLLLVNCYSA